jgi:Fur family ferric uptake transcriptional regulator
MKENALQLLHNNLKENGYSVTTVRQLIFDLLWDHEPQTMHDLYASAEGRIDRASIYRTISLFQELGLVQRINIGWKYKVELSDAFIEHHHLTCIKCHRIIPINEKELELFINNVANANKFKPIEHQVEMQGYCERCIVE